MTQLTFPVTIDGRDYAVEADKVQLASIEKIRQQADSATEFGESSLNPLDLWRRSQDDWSGGANQEYLDKRTEGERRRFWESGHLDPWDRGSLVLTEAAAHYFDLVDVVGLTSADGRILYVTNTGSDWTVHAADQDVLALGSALYPSLDLYPSTTLYPTAGDSDFTLLATQAGAQAVDVCSDGFYIYVLDGGGVHQVDVTTGTITTVTVQTGDFVDFVKGRLIIGSGKNLYDASSGTATAITPSTINSSWAWASATESGDSIYICGTGGDRSSIYSVQVTEDGASLSTPVPAATLPYGETLNALYGYVDSIVLGTNRGFRMAQVGGQGSLYYGPLVEVGPVTTFTAFGKFVHFGGYTDAGLGFVGKINLGLFVDDLTPAYALDLFTPDTDRGRQGTNYVLFPGASGDLVRATGDPADVTGDLDIRAKLASDDWGDGSTTQTIISKYHTTGDQRSYALSLTSTGLLALQWSEAGTTFLQEVSSAAVDTVFADGETGWVRAALDVDNGAADATVDFYTSTDGENWTALGTQQLVGATTSIFDSSADLMLGSRSDGTADMFKGRIYQVRVYAGTAIVANPTATPDGVTGSTTWTLEGDTSLGFDSEVLGDMVSTSTTFVWLVNDHLWFRSSGNKATSGSIVSGKMAYDLADQKIFERIQVNCSPLNQGESIDVSILVDDTEVTVTTIDTLGSIGGDFDVSSTPQSGDTVQYKLVVHRGEDPTLSPEIKRVTMRALPRSSTGDQMILPLILREKVMDLIGQEHNFNPLAEFNALKSIERTGSLITASLWGVEYEAVLDGVQFGPELDYTSDGQGLQGTATVILRTFNPLETG